MPEDTRNIIVGAVALTVLLLAGAFSFSSGAVGALDGLFLKAQFNRVNGLAIGTEVRMGGIKIGEVSGIKLKEDYSAEATLRITKNLRIPIDTSVAIHTGSLFGTKCVTLEPGAEEEYMKGGDSFQMTQDSVDLQDLLRLIIGQAKSNQAKLKEKLEQLKQLQAGSKG